MSASPAHPPVGPVGALDRFFAALRRSPVTRSPRGTIGGVCAGLAARLGVSTVIVRVCAVALLILGPALGLYLLAWVLLPDQHGTTHLERAVRGGDTTSILLLIGAVVIILPDAGMHSRMGWFPLVLVAVVAGFGYWAWKRRDRPGPGSPGRVAASPNGPDDGPQDAPRA